MCVHEPLTQYWLLVNASFLDKISELISHCLHLRMRESAWREWYQQASGNYNLMGRLYFSKQIFHYKMFANQRPAYSVIFFKSRRRYFSFNFFQNCLKLYFPNHNKANYSPNPPAHLDTYTCIHKTKFYFVNCPKAVGVIWHKNLIK